MTETTGKNADCVW